MSASATPSKKYWAMTALAGLASGVLFLALIGGAAMMPLVAYFVQLPLFFVGLTLGAASATVASLASVLLVLIASGWLAGLLFAVIEAVPLLVVVRAGLLSRQDAPGGDVDWYPPGMILAGLVVYVLGATLLALTPIALQQGDLGGLIEDALNDVEIQLQAQGQALALGEQLSGLVPFMPGIVAASWIVMVVLNGILGQWLARRQSMALRPSPHLRELVVPSWIIPAMALAAAGTFMTDGNVLIMAATAAVVLAVPLLFQGLAVVHTFVARLAAPRAALFGFYLTLILFSWPLVLVVVLLGIAEEWVQFRQRGAT